MSAPEPCLHPTGRCYSTACQAFGFCRQRAVDARSFSAADAERWRVTARECVDQEYARTKESAS